MTPLDAPRDQLEQTLGRLVDAGIRSPAELAGLLGLESRHIGRPIQTLTLAGVVESDTAGGLQLTSAGRAWLGVGKARAPAPAPPAQPVSAGPPLDPLNLDVDDQEPEAVAPEPQPIVPARRTWAWRPPSSALALPRIGVAVGGVELSAAGARRIAAVGAAAFVLLMGAQAGVRVWGIGAAARPLPPAVTHEAPVEEPLATRAPIVPVPTARWVVVQHTHGLGLVLRPAPASSERVLTLQEGARVRVTGDPIQQDGRAWLPVASLSGRTGWVAGEFVDPAP